VSRRDQGTWWGLGEVRNNGVCVRCLDARSVRGYRQGTIAEGLSVRGCLHGRGFICVG
jgi:hypothetical protein